jgi:ATP-dependent Lhr-like helicase
VGGWLVEAQRAGGRSRGCARNPRARHRLRRKSGECGARHTAPAPEQEAPRLVDSRRGSEELGKQLGNLGVTAFVTHGSLSAPERRDAERAFETGRDCVIVATSALELGIDVGDLDHVLQIDAPSTVASFLQRIGRTGRCAETKTTAGSCARRSRWSCRRRHWSGSTASASSRPCARRVVPRTSSRTSSWRAASSRAASALGDWWAWLEGATPFADLSERASRAAHARCADSR